MDLIEEKVRRIEGILIQIQNEIVKVFKALADNGQVYDIEERSKSIEEFLNRVLVKIVDGHFNDTATDGHDYDDGENSQIFESDELDDFDDPGDPVDDGPDLDLKCPIKIEGFNYQNNISPILIIERLPEESLMTNNNNRKTRSMSKPEPEINDKIEKLHDNHRINTTKLPSSSNKTTDLLVECRKRKLVIVLEKLPNYSDSDGLIKENNIGKRQKIQLKAENNELSDVEAQNSPYDMNDNDNDADYQNESSISKPGNSSTRLVCTKCKKKKYFDNESGLKYHNQRFHSTFKFSCKIDKCKRIFNSQKAYQKHVNVNHTFCKLCSKKFDSRYLYLNHLVTEHNKDENLWFPCLHCPKKYLQLKNLRNHNYTVHKVKQFCYQDYKRRKIEIDKLPKTDSDENLDTNRNVNQIVCKICSDKFDSRNLYLIHNEAQHKGENENVWFYCVHCPKKYLQLKHLRNHSYKAHKVKKFSINRDCRRSRNEIEKSSKIDSDEALDEALDTTTTTTTTITTTPTTIRTTIMSTLKCDQVNCIEEFTSKIDYLKHRNSAHFMPIYPCSESECPEIFAQIAQRTRHARKYHPVSVADCTLICDFEGCSRQFYSDKKHLYDFHRFTHEIQDFELFREQKICPFCHKKFEFKKKTDRSYRLHIMGHHPDSSLKSRLQCKYCEKSFKLRRSLVDHQKTHLNYKFPCPECSMSFNMRATLNVHKQNRHGTFVCTYEGCSKRFNTSQSLELHSKDHEEVYICHKCSTVPFKSKKQLRDHMGKCHKEYPCEYEGCSQIFYKIGHLKKHEAAEHDSGKVPEFLCTTCGKAMWSKLQLSKHNQKSHNERLKCDFEDCGQFCSSKKAFEKHKLSHKKDRDLQEALKNSTGPKFQCEYCERIYTQAQSLKYHVKNTHLNEREFLCTHENCGKGFKNERALGIHAESHLRQESRNTCTFCYKIYSLKQDLIRHISKYHKKERDYPFKCSERDCGESFYRNKFLQDHIQKVHSNQGQ